MAIAFVQSVTASANAGSVTTAAITTTSGNFISAMAADAAAIPGTSGLSDSKSNSWTRDKAPASIASGGAAAAYSARNITGGASHTFTYTRTSSTQFIAICVAEFSGLGTGPVVDQSAVVQGTTSVPPHGSGAVTTTQAAELVIGGASLSATINATQSTLNFTEVMLAASATQQGVIQAIATSTTTTGIGYRGTATAPNTEGIGIATFKATSPAYVQSKTAQANATSVTTAAMTTTSSNFLVTHGAAFVRTFSGTPISDSKSNTWNNAWVANGGTNGHAGCYYSENITGGASHTVTYTSGGAADFLAVGVSECSGVSTSSLDKTSTSNASGTLHDSGTTATLAQATELVVGGWSLSHNLVSQSIGFAPTDFTDIAVTVSGSVEGCLLAYQIVSSTGTFQLFAANKPSTGDAALIVTYKPGSAGGGGLFHRAALDGLGAGGGFFDNPLSRT